MKKIINATMLTLVALLVLTFNASAQTAAPAPTPERIDLSKEGEVKSIQFTIKGGDTRKFAVHLPKDKYLWVYFSDPSLDNAPPSTVKIDSAQTTYTGAPGSRADVPGGVIAKLNWELLDNADKKIFAGSERQIDTPQIAADGEYFLTVKCITVDGCTNWLRVKTDKNPSVQAVTVDFP